MEREKINAQIEANIEKIKSLHSENWPCALPIRRNWISPQRNNLTMPHENKIDAREKERLRILKNFIKEMFPINELFKCGFFTKEMKGDYEKMAERICYFFGYKTVFEYRIAETRCHITFDGDRPKYINPDGKLVDEPFITVIPSWLDE